LNTILEGESIENHVDHRNDKSGKENIRVVVNQEALELLTLSFLCAEPVLGRIEIVKRSTKKKNIPFAWKRTRPSGHRG